MSARTRSALWAAAAALNGAAGVAAARCGGACTHCLACAVPAAGVVLLALAGARRRARPAPAGPPGAARSLGSG